MPCNTSRWKAWAGAEPSSCYAGSPPVAPPPPHRGRRRHYPRLLRELAELGSIWKDESACPAFGRGVGTSLTKDRETSSSIPSVSAVERETHVPQRSCKLAVAAVIISAVVGGVCCGMRVSGW